MKKKPEKPVTVESLARELRETRRNLECANIEAKQYLTELSKLRPEIERLRKDEGSYRSMSRLLFDCCSILVEDLRRARGGNLT